MNNDKHFNDFPDPAGEIVKTIKAISVYVVVIFLISWACCGCKLLRHVEKVQRDSTAVSKLQENASHTDSSSYKKENDYTRTTFIYPRDTVINNFYSQPANDYRPPAIIIHETGKQTEQGNQYSYDEYWKNKYDSTITSNQAKTAESKTDVLPVDKLMITAVITILLSVLLSKISLKNLFTQKNTAS